MVLLLLASSVVYFINGQTGEAIFMVAAIAMIASISVYQNYRSRKALRLLQSLTQPACRVIRDGAIITINREEVVPGDYLLAEEGTVIAADGIVLQANDFMVNESTLTGESNPVAKSKDTDNNKVYSGTAVTRGLAICEVTATGQQTELGKIGKNLLEIRFEASPLQKQIRAFVRTMAFIGAGFFLAVWLLNFLETRNLLDSLLRALALAMSILPEEIPVAFTTFMALGAWKLARMGVIVKSTATVETLGSASVICLDKTGTITTNHMQLASVYSFSSKTLCQGKFDVEHARDVIATAMWASEPVPFDPMEVALHEAYAETTLHDERKLHTMLHEYPLDGQPPMMTHIFARLEGQRVIAAKGAPEAIMAVCKLSEAETISTSEIINTLTSSGARVLGVASSEYSGPSFPIRQQDLPFRFVGLVSFYDPPKPNIASVLKQFADAGIKVKILTGDYPNTTLAIARQVGLEDKDDILDGATLMGLDNSDLKTRTRQTTIFTRMFPQAKLRVINTLKDEGHVVAMTGDGVNDALALKAAHIGIAMGKRGTEMAKEVSALVLTDDDLGSMVSAIALGRKIYTNLKNAVQYIISIHISIILTVFVPLLLGWRFPGIFTPVHVIFLELIMGPTCSIVFENEPQQGNLMNQRPRPLTRTFFSIGEISRSIVQGLVIALGVLGVYQYAVHAEYTEPVTRAMVFVTVIAANIFLTLVNRSSQQPIWISIRYRNRLVPMIIGLTVALTAMILYIPPVAHFFQVGVLSPLNILTCTAVGLASVTWIEILKFKR